MSSVAGAAPPELKPIAPYLARAKELQAVEPVISYWCRYYALQQALGLGVKENASNAFLMEMMDRLEAASHSRLLSLHPLFGPQSQLTPPSSPHRSEPPQSKSELATNEAITDDAAASAYVENFAVKLFDQADDEDRKGKSTRLTAKKFLAAANFYEILATFGELSSENREKIKYAKWKASDIAKAFREGRQPTPGPAGGLPPLQDDDGSRGEVTSEEAKELARELAALGTTGERQGAIISDPEAGPAQSTRSATVPSTADDPDSYPFPQHPTTPLPPALPAAIIHDLERAVTPPPPPPTAPTSTTFLDTPSDQVSSSIDLGPTTPSIPITHQTSELAPPPSIPSFQSSSSPNPLTGFASAVFPYAPPVISQEQEPEPSPIHSRRPLVPTSIPTPTSSTFTHSKSLSEPLDPMKISQIQKHAKWAISALNYEDVETAKKELKIALGMLG